MKIFITVNCSTEALLKDDHQITVLDTQWFGNFLSENKI